MRFVQPLSDAEVQSLRDASKNASKPAQRRRAHGILLSHKGYTINQISEILDVQRDTVTRWLNAWQRDGLDGLADKARAGRPSVYDDQDRERLQALVAETPHQIRALQARMAEETGKPVSLSTVQRALKKAGVQLQKSAEITAKSP